MPRIQVVSVTPFAGIGKVSNKPFNMLRVKCVVTDDQGNVELGELAFFQQQDRPLPSVKVGGVYEPVVSFEAEKGNLVARITGLNALAASSVPRAA